MNRQIFIQSFLRHRADFKAVRSILDVMNDSGHSGSLLSDLDDKETGSGFSPDSKGQGGRSIFQYGQLHADLSGGNVHGERTKRAAG